MNKPNKTDGLSLNTILIIGVTVLFIGGALGINMLSKKNDAPDNSVANQNNVATAVEKNIPDATKGDINSKIDSTITFRDITFDMSEEDVKNLEAKNDDTLDNPTLSKSGDGYTYIYYTSNPDSPLKYNNVAVGTQNAPGLTYVFHNDSLEEVRLQFGAIDEASFNSLISSIKGAYGESTFYRATNGTETYWWSAQKQLLMLTQDSYSTTIFFRRN